MTDDEAVRRVIAAWTAPGISPETHREAQRSVHWRWPVLAEAIENLVAASTQNMPPSFTSSTLSDETTLLGTHTRSDDFGAREGKERA